MTRHLDWTEALYAEDACDERWARLARSTVPQWQRWVVNKAGTNSHQRPRKGDWRGLHTVAKRVRDAP